MKNIKNKVNMHKIIQSCMKHAKATKRFVTRGEPVRQSFFRISVLPRIKKLMPLMKSCSESVEPAMMKVKNFVLALAARHDQLTTGARRIGEEESQGSHLA